MPHTQRNPAGASGGASESVSWDNRNASEVKPTSAAKQEQLKAELAAARRHLENRTHNLEVISAWRDELRVRLARSQLRMELIGLSDEEQQRLVEEIEVYKRCCRALNWSTNGRAR